jgi:hypothetical protein
MGRESRAQCAAGGVNIPCVEENSRHPDFAFGEVGPPHEGEVWANRKALGSLLQPVRDQCWLASHLFEPTRVLCGRGRSSIRASAFSSPGSDTRGKASITRLRGSVMITSVP